MVEGLLLFAVVFLVTFGFGLPLASRASWRMAFRAHRKQDHRHVTRISATTSLTAVEFKEDNLTWPSMVERAPTAMPALTWPSSDWDDEHFGKIRPSSAPRRQLESVPEPTPVVPSSSTSFPLKRTSEPTVEVGQLEGPPGRDQINAMIDDVGIVGAVKSIMASEGWTFQDAARFVSRR
jgi:hypothetical protein